MSKMLTIIYDTTVTLAKQVQTKITFLTFDKNDLTFATTKKVQRLRNDL